MAEALPATIDRAALVHALAALGVPRGGLVMVHSSLRSLGAVDGGANTVVAALLESLGPEGTLVAPAFTYPVAKHPGFAFDPANTPSCMGAISDAVRRHPAARRSLHLNHSVAAIGPLAAALTTAQAWTTESPIGQVIGRAGHFLLLGVPYQNLTAMHFMEVALGVPYRTSGSMSGRLRLPDGSLGELVSHVTPSRSGHVGSDYNRIGQALDDAGVVAIGAVGNALARLVAGSEVRDACAAYYARDPLAFVRKNGALTRLTRGHAVDTARGTLCVVDPARIYVPTLTPLRQASALEPRQTDPDGGQSAHNETRTPTHDSSPQRLGRD